MRGTKGVRWCDARCAQVRQRSDGCGHGKRSSCSKMVAPCARASRDASHGFPAQDEDLCLPGLDDPCAKARPAPTPVGKGRMGSALIGATASFMLFDRGAFGVLPLTYFYIHKGARSYLFPQSVKIHDFCSGPVSVDPVCPQPRAPHPGTDMPRRPTSNVLGRAKEETRMTLDASREIEGVRGGIPRSIENRSDM